MPPNQQTDEEREMLRDLLAVLACEHCAHFTPLVEALQEAMEAMTEAYEFIDQHRHGKAKQVLHRALTGARDG